MDISYQIVYSKRRTIALTIQRDGSLVVRAPKVVLKQKIKEFVDGQQAWIGKTLTKVEKLKTPAKQIIPGEKFLYLGFEYQLSLIDEYRSRLLFDGCFILSKYKQSAGRKLFYDWYRSEAYRVISEVCKTYAPKMGVAYKRITIKDTGSRWGSCSSLGNLNFSFRLIMAPLEILEYVVVHELAHLRHQNHSRQFWDMVGAHYPSYMQARRWLRLHGNTLAVF